MFYNDLIIACDLCVYSKVATVAMTVARRFNNKSQ